MNEIKSMYTKIWNFEDLKQWGQKNAKFKKCKSVSVFFKLFYYMASIEYTLRLAVFLWWLGITSLVSKALQSVFNLIVVIFMDVQVMVNWQLSKMVSADHDQCQLTVSWVQVYNSLSWRVFKSYLLTSCWFQLIAGSGPRWKGHIINNLLTLSIARSIHPGLGLRFPCNDQSD